MATIIKTKNSTTAATAPTGLVQGELAVNITDKKLYVGDSVGNSIQIAGAGATNAAGGSTTQVQYNSSGSLAGSANLTFDGTTFVAPFTSLSGNGVVLTVDRTGTGGNDRTNMQFSNSGTVRGGIGTVGASNGIYFNYGTTEGMRIDSSGNVGIGTSSPSYPLDIQKSIAVAKLTSTTTTAQAYFAANNGGGDFYIGRDNSAGSAFGIGAYASVLYSQGAYPMVFLTNSTERMRIDSSGNVGIGANITASAAGGGLSFTVGSGTGNPAMTLYSATNGASQISFADATSGTGAYDGYVLYNQASQYMAFGTSATERMRIDSSGNVGIGCTPSTISGAAAYRQFFVGSSSGSGMLANGTDTYFLSNLYYDGAFKAANSANCANYQMSGATHYWRSGSNPGAGAAVTMTPVMSLDLNSTLALQGATTQSGTGITFPATQSASSNANTLDDYEEGTWTPTVFGNSTAGTYTLSGVNAHYTKIGNQVTVYASFSFSVASGGTGYAKIGGLPFSYRNNSSIAGSILAVNFNFTSSTPATITVNNTGSISDTTLYIAETIDNAAANDAPISGVSTSTYLQFSISYTVS